jgi:putative transposase
METVKEMGPRLGVAPTCAALGFPRSTYYRRLQPPAARRPRPRPKQALSHDEKKAVLAVLHEDRFADQAPAEVHAQLLDEGRHLCSIRTMYRVLDENCEVKERRAQLRHPVYVKPELMATAPNQVWSWDITKLRGPLKGIYFHLYVLLDIFSRYVVGWLLAHKESAALAAHLIRESCARQGIEAGQLAVHADHGPAMISRTVATLLDKLDVANSHSRPYVSDDNPFSEAQFKTLKYHPGFPDRFGGDDHAGAHCRSFFPWYNTQHHHSGIGFMTPHDVHYGHAAEKWRRRAEVLLAAYRAHPERYPRGVPLPPPLPTAAWINKPADSPIIVAEPAGCAPPTGAQAGDTTSAIITLRAEVGR